MPYTYYLSFRGVKHEFEHISDNESLLWLFWCSVLLQYSSFTATPRFIFKRLGCHLLIQKTWLWRNYLSEVGLHRNAIQNLLLKNCFMGKSQDNFLSIKLLLWLTLLPIYYDFKPCLIIRPPSSPMVKHYAEVGVYHSHYHLFISAKYFHNYKQQSIPFCL